MERKGSIFRKPAVQTLVSSLVCILLGMLIGFIALLIINPAGAWDALMDIIRNFWNYSKVTTQMKNLGNTLVKTAPLVMCSLSVLFAYKVGLFNIGAAGQYVAGAGACIYCAVGLGWSWFPCMAAALLLGFGVAAVYRMTTERYTQNFLITLALLPMLVEAVILMTSGNLGTAVAVAGAFSLVRFRSVQGTSREILGVFLAMAIGLACGMGQITFAALFTAVAVLTLVLFSKSGFAGKEETFRHLRITIPEDLGLVFKALADPSRMKIVRLLWGSPATTSYLSYVMGLAPSTVSGHLKLMLNAGILRCQTVKQYVYYEVDRSLLENLGDRMLDYIREAEEQQADG